MPKKEKIDMGFYELLIIALALSLDAFGVALGIGLNDKARFNNKIINIAQRGAVKLLFRSLRHSFYI